MLATQRMTPWGAVIANKEEEAKQKVCLCVLGVIELCVSIRVSVSSLGEAPECSESCVDEGAYHAFDL